MIHFNHSYHLLWKQWYSWKRIWPPVSLLWHRSTSFQPPRPQSDPSSPWQTKVYQREIFKNFIKISLYLGVGNSVSSILLIVNKWTKKIWFNEVYIFGAETIFCRNWEMRWMYKSKKGKLAKGFINIFEVFIVFSFCINLQSTVSGGLWWPQIGSNG